MTDWKTELDSYVDKQSEENDDVRIYLTNYSKVVRVFTNSKVVLFTFIITLYIFIFGVFTNDPTSFKPGMNINNLVNILLLVLTLFNVYGIKRKPFGPLLDNSDGLLGYYELLDAQLKYLSTFTTAISKQSRKREWMWLWMFFMFIPVTIFFMILLNYNARGLYGRIYQIVTLGYILDIGSNMLNAAHGMISIASLIHGSFCLRDLCSAWVDIFLRYRHFSKKTLQDLLDKVNRVRKDPLTIQALRKDLFERYLFIVGTLLRASDIWSLSLTCYIVVCTLVFIFLAYFAFKTSDPYFYYCEILILMFVTFLVSSIAFANTAVHALKDAVKHSLPLIDDDDSGDFSVIGGRELWLKYFDEVPCYWRIYGFALTPQWLQGFITGAVVTIVVSLLPLLTSHFMV